MTGFVTWGKCPRGGGRVSVLETFETSTFSAIRHNVLIFYQMKQQFTYDLIFWSRFDMKYKL